MSPSVDHPCVEVCEIGKAYRGILYICGCELVHVRSCVATGPGICETLSRDIGYGSL